MQNLANGITADLLTPFTNLGLISDVTNDIADIYACATTEEQAYCVSKAKSYGVFTGVNGSVYNKCVADICAAKQPELTNLLGGLITDIATNTVDVLTPDVLTPESTTAEIFLDENQDNIALISATIDDIYACE